MQAGLRVRPTELEGKRLLSPLLGAVWLELEWLDMDDGEFLCSECKMKQSNFFEIIIGSIKFVVVVIVE